MEKILIQFGFHFSLFGVFFSAAGSRSQFCGHFPPLFPFPFPFSSTGSLLIYCQAQLRGIPSYLHPVQFEPGNCSQDNDGGNLALPAMCCIGY